MEFCFLKLIRRNKKVRGVVGGEIQRQAKNFSRARA
jgi:hypothetical protein